MIRILATTVALILLGGCNHPFEQAQSLEFYPVFNITVDNGNELVQQQSWTRTADSRESRRDAELRERTERLREEIATGRQNDTPTESAYDKQSLEALRSSSDEDRIIHVRVGRPAIIHAQDEYSR